MTKRALTLDRPGPVRSDLRIHATAAVLVLLLVSACTAPPARPVAPELSPRERLDSLVERRDAIESIRASVRLAYRGPDATFRSRNLVSATPDALRIDALGPIGPTARIVASEDRLRAYDVGEGVFYEGEASPGNLDRLVRVPLAPAEAFAILVAAPDPDDTSLAFRFDPSTGRLSGVEETDAAGLVWTADFADYDDANGLSLPRRITATFPRRDVAIELTLSDVEPNPKLGPEIFRLDPPPGARHVDLDGR